MLRNLRRLVAVEPIAAVFGGRPTSQRFFGAATLAIGALVPAGLVPLPTAPAQPAAPAPLAAGAVLTAVDNAGHPLAYAQFQVYRADQPEGVQQPVLPVPVVSSTGTVSVPLPQPATIPDAASNYYVVSTGTGATGAPFTGIEFFNLTAEQPVATAAISPNLFVQVPSVTVIGGLPQVGDQDPPPVGPCGYDPDVAHPPTPNAFTIKSRRLSEANGTVNVGVVYGAGNWPGNTGQADVRYEPYRAMGEDLESEWSRATQNSVALGLDLGGATQTKYKLVGSLHFTLKASDVGDYASRGGGASIAGHGARAFVVPATWEHQTMTFECNNADHTSETHELWAPHEWNPHVSTSTPDYPTDNNTLEAMVSQDASLVFPMAQNQENFITAGQSQTYHNGYGAAIGAGPVGLDFTVDSQSTNAYNHKTTIYSGDGCGTVDTPLCFYWAIDNTKEIDCQYQMACGTDYYTAIYKTPPAVPVGPQPCSRFEPHGACD